MARILVVDDRSSNRHYLKVVLDGFGHEVIEAADGAQALVRTRELRPHLVITDLLMPVMSGFEFVKQLRSEPDIAATPVAFYTATYRSNEAHRLAEACGVTEVLPKPTGPSLLIDAVNRLLGQSAAAAVDGGTGREPSSLLTGLEQRMAGHIDHAAQDRELIDGLLSEHRGPDDERERLRRLSSDMADNLSHVQRSASRIFALIELALDLAGERRRDAFLRMFCEASRRIVDADAVALVLLEADGRSVRHVEAFGLPPSGVQALSGPAIYQQLLGGVWDCCGALRRGDGREPLKGLPPELGPVRGFLAVPIGASAQYGALLFIDAREGRCFDDEDEMLALALAGEFAVIFELFDANESLQSRAVELELQINQRRQAEQAQAEALGRLDGMIQAAMDAIITVDRAQQVVLFNPAAERMFGRRAAEMLGRPLDDLLPESARAQHAEHVRAFAAGGPSTRMMSPLRTVRGRRANGETFPIDASISKMVLDSGVYYTAILRDVTQRVQANQALERYRVELAGFSQRLLEQEKHTTRRLAQALHDELGQTLAAMRLIYDASRTLAGPEANNLMERLDGLIDDANRQVRQVLIDLRPPLLEELGLAAALDNELRQRAPLTNGVELTLEVPAALQDRRWLPEAEYAAFMVSREAVHNAIRHARPSTIRIVLAGDEAGFDLCVIDDGCGLPIGGALSAPGHLGMVGMRERAHAIGAALEVESAPGQGTTVRLRWRNVDVPMESQPPRGQPAFYS